MNAKIKNYVDVLFSDIPRTKKAQELKQEILSNMNDRFNAYIAEGKTESQAYSLAVAEQGDIDAALADLAPATELKAKIDAYRTLKARNTAIAVALYILSPAVLILFSCLPALFGFKDEDMAVIVGLILMFLCIAAATGLLIFTRMSIPQDVEPYMPKTDDKQPIFSNNSKKGRLFNSVLGLYWSVVTIIYLVVSFTTMAWHITWLIWLIASAVHQALVMIFRSIEAEKE